MQVKKQIGIIGALLAAVVLFLGNGTEVRAEEVPDGARVETVDMSSLVYQAGGWGTPQDEDIIFYQADSSKKEKVKAAVCKAMKDRVEEFNIEAFDIPGSDFQTLVYWVAEVLNENPELFYVNTTAHYVVLDKIYLIIFTYDYTDAQIKAMTDQYNQKIAAGISLLDDSMSQAEKALVLHDYLAQHCRYAEREFAANTLDRVPNVYNAYGALVSGYAVCQGYMTAYKGLLNAAGIASFQSLSDEMNHVWNVVFVDGAWYHVDVTWDDPISDTEGRVLHKYFLLSDREIANRQHSNWKDNVECVSTLFDSEDIWWNSVSSQIVIEGGAYYYIDDDSFKSFRLVKRTGEKVTTLYSSPEDMAWWASEYENSRYANAAYLSRQGDYLYFNGPTALYALPMENLTSEPKVVCGCNPADGLIFGAMVYEDGKLRVNISKTGDTTQYIELDISGSQFFSPGKTGLFEGSDKAWYYYVGGKRQTGYNGYVILADTCWVVANGKVDLGYTGIWGNETQGWWYAENGRLNFGYNGFAPFAGGWWTVCGGKVYTDYTGLWGNDVQGWWYAKNGMIDMSYTGKAVFAGISWNVVNGQVVF